MIVVFGNLPETWDLAGAEIAFSAAAAHALLTHHGNVRSALHSIAPITASLPAAEQRPCARSSRRRFGRGGAVCQLLEPDEAHRLGLDLIRAAEAATSDAMLVRFVGKTLGAPSDVVTAALADWRRMRGEMEEGG